MPGITTTGLISIKLKSLTRETLEQRKILESLHTAATENADNNSKPLTKQYANLIDK